MFLLLLLFLFIMFIHLHITLFIIRVLGEKKKSPLFKKYNSMLHNVALSSHPLNMPSHVFSLVKLLETCMVTIFFPYPFLFLFSYPVFLTIGLTMTEVRSQVWMIKILSWILIPKEYVLFLNKLSSRLVKTFPNSLMYTLF